jgi:hypothetical protein
VAEDCARPRRAFGAGLIPRTNTRSKGEPNPGVANGRAVLAQAFRSHQQSTQRVRYVVLCPGQKHSGPGTVQRPRTAEKERPPETSEGHIEEAYAP